MAYDEVFIDPPVAASGLLAWESSAQLLSSAVQARITAIESGQRSKPWGSDSGGPEFEAAYLEGADPSLGSISGTVEQITRLGQQAHQAVDASLASDAEQAAAVTVPVESGL
ncbi:MAG: hypothetical protein F2825_09525 [Actinobacteria bacterium]|uniref:Unannotated protein n=1 Tax=freshwater metagenome TaxID=449393 RepID=A0A6J7IDI6_9ZZZZ|nr:hypothetical protein [Actinomycetota bacterium]